MERGECGMECDIDCEGVRDGAWWLSLGGRGERGGSSGGLKGSIRSISVRRGGGGMKSSSDRGISLSKAASSARDRWSTMPAPKESPTTLMEVRIRSLKTQSTVLRKNRFMFTRTATCGPLKYFPPLTK